VFSILDSKERKVVLKSFKGVLVESLTNKVAHLFIVHMLNTLDDTVLSKKKILSVIFKVQGLGNDKEYGRSHAR